MSYTIDTEKNSVWGCQEDLKWCKGYYLDEK